MKTSQNVFEWWKWIFSSEKICSIISGKFQAISTNHVKLPYSRGSWSVAKMLHQFICSQEQIDLAVDGIVYKPQKSDHSGHFLLCCDWPLVPKLTVIGAFNRKLINYLGNHKIFKYFIKWIGSCWQMNWYNILETLQLPRL